MSEAKITFDFRSSVRPSSRPRRKPAPTVSDTAVAPDLPIGVTPAVIQTVASTVQSFEDAITYVAQRSDWPEALRTARKTALRQIGRSIALIEARQRGLRLVADKQTVDFAHIPFNVPAINQALEGISYGLAGFRTNQAFRNAKSGLRLVGRALDIIAPMKAARLPADTPYTPLLANATKWNASAARLFAARLHEQGRHPSTVTCADLLAHGAFLRCWHVGVKVDAALKRIAQLWQQTATQHPDWPQTPLTLPTKARVISPPLSLYPLSLQQDVATVRRWMEGGAQSNPFSGADFARKPFRPDTIAHHIQYIRLMLGVLVERGAEPVTLTSLQCLLHPEPAQAMLQVLWDRGQQRRAALPAHERSGERSGATGQTHHAGLTLLMLATHCFPQPPAALSQLRHLAKAVRLPKQSRISRRNRSRLDQFDDPATLRRLLALPYELMQEALKREKIGQRIEAARLARAAVLFAIEIRIPLRIKNLQCCRLGHNLRFAGARSQMVILTFAEHETKNTMALEFFVGPRLCTLLSFYIKRFLPLFADQSPDWVDQQWLFPACEGLPGPLSINQVRKIIIDTAAERVGVVLHPHLFRALAVKLCLRHAPGALEQCRQLLGDKTLDVILRHYASVQQREAAAYLDTLVNAEEDRLGQLVLTHTQRPGRRGGRS